MRKEKAVRSIRIQRPTRSQLFVTRARGCIYKLICSSTPDLAVYLPKVLSEEECKQQGVVIRSHLSHQCRIINRAHPCLMSQALSFHFP